MRRDTSIALGDHFADFVDQQVGGGRYGSASDVVRAGLRLLEEQEARLEALRAALLDGEGSGAGTQRQRLSGFPAILASGELVIQTFEFTPCSADVNPQFL